MDAWLDEVAASLGVPPLSPRRASVLLKVARDVAHNVERRYAPLSTYLVGAAVASRVATGTSEEDAFESAIRAIRALVPASPPRPDDQA